MSALGTVFLLAGCSSEQYTTPGALSALTGDSGYQRPPSHPKPPTKPPPGQPSSVDNRPVIGEVALAGNLNIGAGMPGEMAQPEILISRHQYVLSWNETTRNLNWSAWELDASFIGNVGRTNHFIPDPDLSTYFGHNSGGAPVQGTDYTASCFDRGHQTPSGDRTDSVDDNANTFVMSNMIPQTAWLNRVVWEHFEAHIRTLVTGGAKFYIFAGPIYDAADVNDIGPSKNIRVPARDFKILVQGGATPKVAAVVIMPNVTSKGTNPATDHAQACTDQHGIGAPPANAPTDWQKYLTTVADVEQQSGIDFSFLSQ